MLVPTILLATSVALTPTCRRTICPRMMCSFKEEDEGIEAARVRLERMVQVGGADNTKKVETFRFGSSPSPPPTVVDDIAQGADEIADVASKGGGVFFLLLDICINGILSPFGLISLVLFGLLYSSGEFGVLAPSATEGSYYRAYVLDVDGVPILSDN